MTYDPNVLKQGAFYWVKIVSDDDTCEADKEWMPARFTGNSGGSPPRPTWDFLGQPADIEVWEVDQVNSMITTTAERDALRTVRDHIDVRMNNLLVGTKPGYDDTVEGINAAWDISRKAFAGILGDAG